MIKNNLIIAKLHMANSVSFATLSNINYDLTNKPSLYNCKNLKIFMKFTLFDMQSKSEFSADCDPAPSEGVSLEMSCSDCTKAGSA